MVYVDELQNWGWRHGPSCHLVTDGPLEELHAFAARLGLKRAWFQPGKRKPHYDLTAGRRAAAVRAGAAEVDSRRLIEILRGRE